MLVTSAIKDHSLSLDNYFPFDAAVAIEAYDASALNTEDMCHSDWSNYVSSAPNASNPRRLWAAEWHNLFDAGDGRRKLSWRGRFGPISTAHNFYSTGEEVLNNTSNGEHNSTIGLVTANQAERAWVTQELSKGRDTIAANLTWDSNAGWGFNAYWFVSHSSTDPFGHPILTPPERRYPEETASISDEALKSEPFFLRFQDNRLMNSSQGSAAANEYLTRAKTLAESIPSLSFAQGRNPVGTFEQRNYDLMSLKNEDGAWPQSRLSNDKQLNRWLHGDAKDVAYRFNYLLYKKWVELGELK
ncbi:MAG TPA: hypothetical protein VIT23_05875 [Terrimicrobiaceae bacterium]